MTRIFLCRHGQSEGNNCKRVQGRCDVPLTELGRAQAGALAERFRTVPLTAAYASPLCRAMETAETAAALHGLPVLPAEGLQELDVGVWEDRAYGAIGWENPALLEIFCTCTDRWHVEGSETVAEVGERMEAALRGIGRANPGGTVLAVSHGMATRCLLSRLFNRPIAEMPNGGNTAVALLLYDETSDRLTVDYYNDTAHVPPELKGKGGKSGWWMSGDTVSGGCLRFEPFDMQNGRELYVDAYRDAWRVAHGSEEGFSPDTVWAAALQRMKEFPDCILAAKLGDETAGILACDQRRGRGSGYLWLAFCWVREDFRGRGMGGQLLGELDAKARRLGRRAVRLCVAPGNPALGFYKHGGFTACGTEPGVLEDLILMEKPVHPARAED